jgi:hypothetical protein
LIKENSIMFSSTPRKTQTTIPSSFGWMVDLDAQVWSECFISMAPSSSNPTPQISFSTTTPGIMHPTYFILSLRKVYLLSSI